MVAGAMTYDLSLAVGSGVPFVVGRTLIGRVADT